ncbi:MAG: AAA family ATPase [Bacteroidales bacterium]
MLTHLSISNFVLIEKLEVEFPSGLTIISGETGAGKSILLGALSLLLGERAGLDALKESDKNCIVEGHFSLSPNSPLHQLLQEIEIESSTEVIVRKVITPSGRGRSFVNDQPVKSSTLKEIAKELVDIHTQNEHLLLSDSSFRLDVLDSFASNATLRERYRAAWDEVGRLEREVRQQRKMLEQEEQEYEYNKFQLEELERANLLPGELKQLEEELKLLSNIEEIKSSLYQIEKLLNSNETSLVQRLREVETLYAKIAPTFAKGEQLALQVESCRIELAEIERENRLLAEATDANPQRLLMVEERASLIYSLLQKHRVKEVEELIELKGQFAAKLDLSHQYRERISQLEQQLKEEREVLASNAAKLSKSRSDASQKFSESVKSRVRELEMPNANFRVILTNRGHYTLKGQRGCSFFLAPTERL